MWYNAGFLFRKGGPKVTRIRIVLFLLALASPVLLAVELADEFHPHWSCSGAPWISSNFSCISVCNHYDGSTSLPGVWWECPGSTVGEGCQGRPCRTQAQYDARGLHFRPCHDRETWVCAAKARRENPDLMCPVKGPPGSAIKVGDCVLRVRKLPNLSGVRLERICPNTPYNTNAIPREWQPVNKAALDAWFYADGEPGGPPQPEPCPDSDPRCN